MKEKKGGDLQVINNTNGLKQELIESMDSYFELDGLEFSSSKGEMYYVAEKINIMELRHISKLITLFGHYPVKHYLEKQRLLGNKFSYEEIEPFIHYLDSYLIENSGGDRKALNQLSNYLIGTSIDYPTQRLIRLSILDKYFAPYLKG